MEKRYRSPSDYFITILMLCFLTLGLTTCDIAGISDIGEGSGSQSPNNQKQTPYADNTNSVWYKGNLHAHTYWSDGNHFPEMVFDWYKSHGYNFAVVSEHNILPEGEKWIRVEDGSHADAMFREYRNKYGENWVEYEDQGSHKNVRLKTFDEFTDKLEEPGTFRILNSEEVDYREGNLLVHMNVTNIQEVIQPAPGGTVAEIMQQHIDEVEQQRNRLNTPMIVQINHPNINWSITADDIKKLEGARFFEVYNGHPNAWNSGDANHKSTEEIWDEVNTDFALDGKPLMYGLAVDDSHWYDSEYNSPGRGWVQVRSASLSGADLIAALKNGNFYSSTGVRFSGISFADSTLTITIDAENGVSYTTQFIGTRSGQTQDPGVVLEEETGTQASYTFSGNELYVRAKVISDKTKANPSEEGEVEVAWVQPIKNNNVSSPPPPPSAKTVYEETLVSPWVDASWNSTINYSSTEHANSGSKSIKVQQESWGGLSIHSGNWDQPKDIDPTKYDGLSFAFYAENQPSEIDVMLENDQGESFPRVSYGTVSANQWTVIEIPMADLNPNNQVIHRIDILESSGTSRTYFVDDLVFFESAMESFKDVYKHNLQDPWINASWSSAIDFSNTDQTYNGSSSSVKVEQDAWGALSLHSGNWGAGQDVNPAQYEAIEFFIYPQDQQADLSVMFENDSGESFPKIFYGSITAGQWGNVRIPMSELNPGNHIIHRIDIMETSGSAKNYFVDNIRLIQN